MRLLPLAILVVVISAASSVYAQVQPIQAGQSLDANYQMGSGGYNRVTGGAGGVNSQLYVTGQVTGLNAFRGKTIAVVNQVQMHVPSNDQSTFTKQSVGATDVLGNRVYQVAPYYSPSIVTNNSKTIAAAGGFAPNQAGYIPGRYIDNSAAQKLFIEATADYRPLMPTAQQSGVPLIQTIVPVEGASSAGSRAEQTISGPANLRPGTSALFAAPNAQNREELARELQEVDLRVDYRVDTQVQGPGQAANKAERTAQGGTLGQPTVEGTLNREAPPAANQQLQAPFNANGPQGALAAPANQNQRTQAQQAQAQQAQGRQTQDRNQIISVTPNQDVFVDMLVKLRQSRGAKPIARTPGQQAQAAQNPELEPSPSNAPEAPAAEGALRKPGVWKGQNVPAPITSEQVAYGTIGGKSRVEFIPGRGVVVHSLTGESNDLFNLQMAKAELSLKGKKYYEAAEQYRTATALNPSNPLAWVGMGMSLLAAREPSSASISFQHALAAFPPLMEIRMDAVSMLDAEVFKTQLSLLDQRIKTEPGIDDQSLLFLAAYLHYSVGEDEIAKDLARGLQAKGANTAVVGAFVEFMLTGKRPAELHGASRPAAE